MTYPIAPISQSTIDLVIDVCKDDAPEVLTIGSIETNGVGCETSGEPRFLCESHTFHDALPEEKRAAAIKAGLATTSWNKATYRDQVNYEGRRAKFDRMIAVDEEAAYRAVSMGFGQVMGANHAVLGYGSAKAMWEAFTNDLEAQVRGTYDLMVSNGTLVRMKARDWAGGSRIWNGPGYKANAYDSKMSSRFAHWQCAIKTGQHQPPAVGSGVFGLGSAGAAVSALQKMLSDAGIATKIDGMYGPITVGSVAAFQVRSGITQAVGLIDQDTADAIATAANESPLGLGARETATLKDVKAASPQVAAASQAKTGAIGTTIAGAAAVGKKAFDHVNDALDQVGTLHGKITGMVGDDTLAAAGKAVVSSLTGSTLPLCLVGVGLAGAIVAHGVMTSGVLNYRSGANT